MIHALRTSRSARSCSGVVVPESATRWTSCRSGPSNVKPHQDTMLCQCPYRLCRSTVWRTSEPEHQDIPVPEWNRFSSYRRAINCLRWPRNSGEADIVSWAVTGQASVFWAGLTPEKSTRLHSGSRARTGTNETVDDVNYFDNGMIRRVAACVVNRTAVGFMTGFRVRAVESRFSWPITPAALTAT